MEVGGADVKSGRKSGMKETDMYQPIKKLLESQGFIVRGEVKGCDIAAAREGEIWLVEMKLSANLTLIYQAMDRQQASNSVFVAIPRPSNARSNNFLSLKKLLRKLGIGLITVALDSPLKYAEVIFFPESYSNSNKINNKKTQAIRNEMLARTVDTAGGNNKTPINTAYRERCIELACLLEASGASSPAELTAQVSGDASKILRFNAYGWFQRVSRGVYEITAEGSEYLRANENTPLVAFYKSKFFVKSN